MKILTSLTKEYMCYYLAFLLEGLEFSLLSFFVKKKDFSTLYLLIYKFDSSYCDIIHTFRFVKFTIYFNHKMVSYLFILKQNEDITSHHVNFSFFTTKGNQLM